MPSAATLYRRLTPIAFALTLVVVVLGAWVRLTDAGLGCPDWPGCYGHLGVPDTAEEIERAESAFPERPVDRGKAWREMIHRYVASTLGLLILIIAAAAVRNRRDPEQPVGLPVVLLGVVIGQGMLGMLTVTWLLKPAIVLAHLIGGMLTLALLGWLTMSIWRRGKNPPAVPARLRRLALAALAIVGVQIALGGWTSTNYAALACPDLPQCQSEWWPTMDFGEAFTFWRGLGVDYEGGVLDNPARTAIHVTHRIGALVVTLVLALLIGAAWRERRCRGPAVVVGAALALQLAIGLAIVAYSLPLALATAHNGVAALLMLAVLNLNHQLQYGRSR